MDIDLENDMKSCPKIIAYCAHEDIATDFYRALCNMQWRKKDARTEDEKIVDRLMGEEPDVWSCTWRYAGGIIADIRNEHHSKNEDYLSFYCAGQEGTVTPLVEECFGDLGWIQCPYDDKDLI